ncbi:protein Star-like [Neocloeon triangulifer]|uniref:protein Star-like n=1 Tax=Neocloeon triangulifer TaxID=2078957 RepID=UPI00286F37BA|nr:protein Star-like [Neocloeon triangulifer]
MLTLCAMPSNKRVVVAILVLTTFILSAYKFKEWNQRPQTLLAYTMDQFSGLAENDPVLLDYTRNLLIEPADRNSPYALFNPNATDYTNMNSSLIAYSLLKNRNNGFFVDCGAFDGESLSSSLPLEKLFNWKGLLVDAGPRQIQRLLLKGRKAWIAPTCMSKNKTSMKVTFVDSGLQSKIVESGTKQNEYTFNVEALCIPFHTFMNVLGITKVDFFNLDVEGNELDILRTIDFDRVSVDLMVIEHYNSPVAVHTEIIAHMERNGFKMHHKDTYDFWFIHKRV